MVDGTKYDITDYFAHAHMPRTIEEAAELHSEFSPMPPASAPAGANRSRLSIEKTYEMLMRKINEAK